MAVIQSNLPPPPLRFSKESDAMQFWHLKVQQSNQLITVDTTDGPATIALPPAGASLVPGQTNQGQRLTYRKTSADANPVKITGSPDGTQTLATGTGAGSVVTFQSDAQFWWVV